LLQLPRRPELNVAVEQGAPAAHPTAGPGTPVLHRRAKVSLIADFALVKDVVEVTGLAVVSGNSRADRVRPLV
jgi:hypothetical protein